MEQVRLVAAPEGEELPFIAPRLHSVAGARVPQPMLYPSCAIIEGAIAAIPAGATSDLVTLRRDLASTYGAEAVCPVTTQRLLLDIAETAVGRWQAGDRGVTPFWRVIDPAKPSAARLAGGAEFIRARRAEEQG
jgi:hypothetical protein